MGPMIEDGSVWVPRPNVKDCSFTSIRVIGRRSDGLYAVTATDDKGNHPRVYDPFILMTLYQPFVPPPTPEDLGVSALLQAKIDSGEVTVTDPDTGGQKGRKPARFDLLPWNALWEVAEHYGKGAEKYEDRNWERGYDWSLSYAALQRHLAAWWQGEDIDTETGSSHLAAAAFHVLALLTFKETHPEKDNRPK
jgi:hypothetical protein